MQRTPAIFITVSALTLAGIAGWEGYRRTAYDDGVGVQTVGFGSTTHADGRKVARGDKMSPERALVRLGQDVDRVQREMKACLGPVPLYPHEWDAYVSLTYNIGTGAF